MTELIEQDQAAVLAHVFEARSVAIALNRMDVGFLIHHFGRQPLSKPQPVYKTIARIWISTIYAQKVLTELDSDRYW